MTCWIWIVSNVSSKTLRQSPRRVGLPENTRATKALKYHLLGDIASQRRHGVPSGNPKARDARFLRAQQNCFEILVTQK